MSVGVMSHMRDSSSFELKKSILSTRGAICMPCSDSAISDLLSSYSASPALWTPLNKPAPSLSSKPDSSLSDSWIGSNGDSLRRRGLAFGDAFSGRRARASECIEPRRFSRRCDCRLDDLLHAVVNALHHVLEVLADVLHV